MDIFLPPPGEGSGTASTSTRAFQSVRMKPSSIAILFEVTWFSCLMSTSACPTTEGRLRRLPPYSVQTDVKRNMPRFLLGACRAGQLARLVAGGYLHRITTRGHRQHQTLFCLTLTSASATLKRVAAGAPKENVKTKQNNRQQLGAIYPEI